MKPLSLGKDRGDDQDRSLRFPPPPCRSLDHAIVWSQLGDSTGCDVTAETRMRTVWLPTATPQIWTAVSSCTACSDPSMRATDLPGLRVILRIGGSRLLRFGVAIFFVGAWLQTILIIRPDLVRPTDIGTDTSNYYAAGQRLADGHVLYALSPGDRPVPQDSPPFFSVPLLSPPPIAVIWRLLAILPDSVVMYAWWIVAALASTALAAFLINKVIQKAGSQVQVRSRHLAA